MTRNEQIAEKMGWTRITTKHDPAVPAIQIGNTIYILEGIGTDTPSGHWLMHLMVQRLAEEGWSVFISIFCNTATMSLTNSTNLIAGKIHAAAEKENHPNGYPVYGSVHADTAPAAVVELFCKVWGIEGE